MPYHRDHNSFTTVKFHLPVKLRAKLLSAVIAVSAAVYNAQASVGTVGGDATICNSALEGVSTTDADGNITVDTTTTGALAGKENKLAADAGIMELAISSMVVVRLDDVDTLTLDNYSVTITGAQGFVDRSGDITLENGSTFSTTAAGIATTGNITLSGQSTISSAQGISGAVISVTNSSLSAGAALTASGKLTGDAAQISAASVSAAGMELTDSQLTANGGIVLNNHDLKLTDSTVLGNIAGATSAALTNALLSTVQVNGELAADHSTLGAISGASNVDLTNRSTVTGDVTMTGALTVTDSTVLGNIMDATGATLTNATTGGIQVNAR